MFTISFESKQKDSNEDPKLDERVPVVSDTTKVVGVVGKHKNKRPGIDNQEQKQAIDGGHEKNMQRWG